MLVLFIHTYVYNITCVPKKKTFLSHKLVLKEMMLWFKKLSFIFRPSLVTGVLILQRYSTRTWEFGDKPAGCTELASLHGSTSLRRRVRLCTACGANLKLNEKLRFYITVYEVQHLIMGKTKLLRGFLIRSVVKLNMIYLHSTKTNAAHYLLENLRTKITLAVPNAPDY